MALKNTLFPRGSEWRKWDLHVHTPTTKLNDQFEAPEGGDVWMEYCKKLEESEVEAYGITDYFSADGYFTFMEKFKVAYPDSKKVFFPNIELRSSYVVNAAQEEVHIHIIFNPFVEKVDERIKKFLQYLSTNKTADGGRNIKASELSSKTDYEEATTTREFIDEAFKETFGEKAELSDFVLVFTAANNDGIRAERGKKRKAVITDELDKFSNGFFGNSSNTDHFLDIDRLDADEEIRPKPVVAGCDAHSFIDLDDWLGKDVEKDGEIFKQSSWIKADLTYEGLKQIVFEPKERVQIGPVKPDEKDKYKVIRKIKFANSIDFPTEIEFNSNLCSIIGSRSSGKSALLAYISHAVDPEMTEEMIDGPGEGEDYHWGKITLDHSVEWDNGKSNAESPGKIVYIRQNYLFEKSKDPNEIKNKIAPVLFKVLPGFETKYKQGAINIDAYNQEISDQVDNWFGLSDANKAFDIALKNIGDKNAIGKDKEEVAQKIQTLKEKNKLGDEELKKYQEISAKSTALTQRVKDINLELSKIAVTEEGPDFFSGAKITLTPVLSGLPNKLQGAVKGILDGVETEILKKANKQVADYRNAILKEAADAQTEVAKINADNKELIEKYRSNIELGNLVKKLNEHADVLKKIEEAEDGKAKAQAQLTDCVTKIKAILNKRKLLIEDLKACITNTKQKTVQGIKFDLEYGFGEEMENVVQKINIKEKTEFVEKGTMKIDEIRQKPGEFLIAIYTKAQKVIAHNDGKEVARDVLTLTESILFTAEMEGDRIGGFIESTMTPGKRALFALRLILAESEDTWPLLIDQPEDDLDSRSLYDEVVPFLKEKKKERQIIMVSHNANLVIGSDSEQVIIANRNGNDRKNEDGKQFNYLAGSLEYSQSKDKSCKDTLRSQGVCEHACEILDGGKQAFESRKNKYNIK
jgi:ABC-type cobalamin/Fe3+-siderophores transport system ATPase subunit